jgi:hypothetical protein
LHWSHGQNASLVTWARSAAVSKDIQGTGKQI